MKEKPAILIITELYPNEEIAFLGIFVANQLKALSEYFRIVAIVPVSAKIKIRQRPANYGGIDVYFFKDYISYIPMALMKLRFCGIDKAFVWRKKILALRIGLLAEKLHRKYNFLLVHGHEPYVGDEAGAVAKRLGIPSVITIHSFYGYHQRLFGKGVMPAIVNNINLADSIVAVSKMCGDSYQAQGVRQGFKIIPNGINRHEAAFEEKREQDKVTILSVGFFAPEKRIEQMLYAAAQLNKKYNDLFRILVVGTGRMEGYYKEIIENNGMQKQIRIVGKVAPSEMAKYYSMADFVVHPSVVDSFSMVCLEAMSAGRPFICTKKIGIVEYITAGREAFIIPPDDIGALQEKMEILLIDKKLRAKMGRAAWETAQKFKSELVIKSILEIYNKLIKDKNER